MHNVVSIFITWKCRMLFFFVLLCSPKFLLLLNCSCYVMMCLFYVFVCLRVCGCEGGESQYYILVCLQFIQYYILVCSQFISIIFWFVYSLSVLYSGLFTVYPVLYSGLFTVYPVLYSGLFPVYQLDVARLRSTVFKLSQNYSKKLVFSALLLLRIHYFQISD